MKRFLAFMFAAAAVASLFVACTPDVDCQDLGCAFGLVCDTESGECVPELRDCRAAPEICTRSEVCDTQTGTCRPRVTQCADSGACPDNQVCDAQSGTCRAATRCSIDGCEPQEVCNAATDRCEPRPCLEDLDCPLSSGFICGDASVCVRGCRPGASTCPQEQTCVTQPGESTGICQERCIEDTDCAFGQICADADGRSQCELEPPCAIDADCRPDEVCIATTCSQPRCVDNDDCDAGQVCQVASGLCFGGNCAEDQFGNGDTRPPNHSMSTAFPLTDSEPELSGLALCPGRSDWFRLDVRTTEIVIVTATQVTPGAALDLYVWDARGALVAADTGLSLRSTVRFDGRADRSVFIEVRPSSDRTLEYDLSVGRDFCPNDTFEENDSYESATTLPLSTDAPALFSLTACGFDQDWFRLPDIDEQNGLRVELRAGSQDLAGVLLAPDGHVYDFRRDQRFETVRSGASGDYYVRVIPELGRSSEYQLLAVTTSPQTCDGANETGDRSSAAPLPPDTTTSRTYCPGSATGWEIQWLRLDGPGSGILDLALEADDNAPPLEVALVQQVGTDITLVKTVPTRDGTARLVAAITPGGNTSYFVRITSNATIGRLFTFPGYDVSYSVSTP